VLVSGIDELSLNGPSEVLEIVDGNVRSLRVEPADVVLDTCALADLLGGDRKENAAILLGILDGSETGARRDLVLLNAAAGFVITRLAPDLRGGLDLAREQVSSGRALAKLQALQSFAIENP
jgi:anthranilate phosphoribosyltransferase